MRLNRKPIGKMSLSVDANTAIFENRQELAAFAHAQSTFDQDTSLSANSTNKQGSKESLVQESNDFLRKACKAMLIEVAIGVIIVIVDNLICIIQ